MASVNTSNHFKRHDEALCDEPGSGGGSHTVDMLTYTSTLSFAYTFIYSFFHIHPVFY